MPRTVQSSRLLPVAPRPAPTLVPPTNLSVYPTHFSLMPSFWNRNMLFLSFLSSFPRLLVMFSLRSPHLSPSSLTFLDADLLTVDRLNFESRVDWSGTVPIGGAKVTTCILSLPPRLVCFSLWSVTWSMDFDVRRRITDRERNVGALDGFTSEQSALRVKDR